MPLKNAGRGSVTARRAQQRWVPGHSWHYMVFCSRCGARPALPLPRGAEVLCRLCGGRLPAAAERWSMGASAGTGNIALPRSTPPARAAHRRLQL